MKSASFALPRIHFACALHPKSVTVSYTSLPRHDQGRDCYLHTNWGGTLDAPRSFDWRNFICCALNGRVRARKIRRAQGGQEVHDCNGSRFEAREEPESLPLQEA